MDERPADPFHAALWDHGRAYGAAAALEGLPQWQEPELPETLRGAVDAEGEKAWRAGFKMGARSPESATHGLPKCNR